MKKYLIWISVCLVVQSCNSTPKVIVTSEKPTGCEFLGHVSTLQCSSGKWGAFPTTADTLGVLKKEALKVGGNTLNCCERSEEEIMISGIDPKSGEITCIALLEHTAEIYSCKP